MRAKYWLLPCFAASSLAATPGVADETTCQAIASKFSEAGRNVYARTVDSFMFEAAGADCPMLVTQLLEAGGSVRVRGREGDSVLHHAARAGADDIVMLLIERGAAIDLRDLSGGTALFYAVQAERKETAQLLLEQGANPNIEGRAGVTPLETAAFNGNRGIVDLLLRSGADSRHIDRTGKGAIVYAVARGFADIAERLIATGIDVNARYGNDLTALMWAAGHSNDVPQDEGVATISMLLDKGARSNDQDNRGRTALMIAAELGHRDAVELLLARGADPSLLDKQGMSARDLAVSEEIGLALSPLSEPTVRQDNAP
jgi:ankyrin repeat protein